MLVSIATVVRVSWPYLWRNRNAFVSSEHKFRDVEVPLPKTVIGASLLLVSDLHVAANGKKVIDSKIDSERTLDRLSLLLAQSSTDGIVLAGDITDTGSPSSWSRVGFVLQQHQKSTSATNVFAVPGNHDVHFAGHNTFLPRFDSYSPSEINKWMQYIDRYSRRRLVTRLNETNVILVLLDSNGRGNTNPITNAIGSVGDKQLARAESQLRKLRQESDVIVVVVHHHVLLPQGGPGRWFLRCLDANAVLAFAEKNDVSVIVTGHLHDPFVTSYGTRRILVISCGSLHHPSRLPDLSQDGTGSSKAVSASAYILSIGPNTISAKLIPLA